MTVVKTKKRARLLFSEDFARRDGGVVSFGVSGARWEVPPLALNFLKVAHENEKKKMCN